MPDYSRYPSRRVEFPANGKLRPKDYSVMTESAAREALARSASTGSNAERVAIRAAVKQLHPDIGKPNKSGDTRDYFPNSQMER